MRNFTLIMLAIMITCSTSNASWWGSDEKKATKKVVITGIKSRPVNEYSCNKSVNVRNRGDGGLGIFTYSSGFSLSLDYDDKSKEYKHYDKYDEDIYSNVTVNNLNEKWYDEISNVNYSSKAPFKIEVIINPAITINNITLQQKYICNTVSQRGRNSNGKYELGIELDNFRYDSLYKEIKHKLSKKDITKLDEFWYTTNFGEYNGSTRNEINKSYMAYKKIILKRAIKFGIITKQNMVSKLQSYDNLYLSKYGL